MQTVEFYGLFTQTETDNVNRYLGITGAGDTVFLQMWIPMVYLAPGQIITGDSFAALVGYLNMAGQLEDGTRYATLMMSQPDNTPAPNIRSL